MAIRCLTKEEKVIYGLSTGKNASLEVWEVGIASRDVFATAMIEKGSWLCEYKAVYTDPLSEWLKYEAEYAKWRGVIYC